MQFSQAAMIIHKILYILTHPSIYIHSAEPTPKPIPCPRPESSLSVPMPILYVKSILPSKRSINEPKPTQHPFTKRLRNGELYIALRPEAESRPNTCRPLLLTITTPDGPPPLQDDSRDNATDEDHCTTNSRTGGNTDVLEHG